MYKHKNIKIQSKFILPFIYGKYKAIFKFQTIPVKTA
jgi:hypothetical protein